MSEHRKIETQIIWHEYGHLVGYEIAECLGGTFGEYEYASLINEERNPHIMRPKDDYALLEHGTPIERKVDLKRVQTNLENTERFFAYSIMLLSGAVFNIAYFSIVEGNNLSQEHFDDCFVNNKEKEKPGHWMARAGGDYSTYMTACIRSNWNFKDVYKESSDYALKIYKCYETHNVFTELIPLIEDFNNNYNGSVVSKIDLEKEAQRISVYLISKSELIDDFKVIVQDMQLKVRE